MAATIDQTIEQKQQSWLSAKLSSQTFWVLIAVILACVFLSFATTLYGVACLLKMRFTRVNAYLMLGLFLLQFFYTGPIDLSRVGDAFGGTAISAHTLIAWTYVLAAVAEVITNRKEIRVISSLRGAIRSMKRAA